MTLPRRISGREQTARAPQICRATDGSLWIAWHAGTGEDMRIEVLTMPAGGATHTAWVD